MQRHIATLAGFAAVLMWAVLALLTAATGDVPPFQLAAMTFLIGGLLGIASWLFRPGAWRALAQDWQAWTLGVCGLFSYHALYYTAIDTAPPVEASLIAYLWPLSLVLFSAMLPGERLRPHHVLGVLLGLAGAALVITKGQGFTLQLGFKTGHLLAFAGSIVWAAYSVLSRRLGRVPTDAVAGFCLATALLALVCHTSFERI
jgi:drug/metabolite transporter (DMT)-like permease